MKNFTERLIGKLIINIVIFIIIWPLVDLAWNALISHEPFQYSFTAHILEPAVFAVISTLALHFVSKKKSK